MQIYPYGVWLALASLAGLIFFALSARKRGLKAETAGWLGVTALPLSVLLARLFYCLCRLTWFCEQGFGWFFRMTEGGFMMYGALLGVLLAAGITAKVTGQKVFPILDTLAAPGFLTYALGRCGDLICSQGYGWPVEDWFSVDAFDPEEYTGMSLFHLEDASFFERLPFAVEDEYYGNYRWAVALLIALLALILMIVLIRMNTKRDGSRAYMGLALLAAVTVLMESMRQDDLMRWGVVRVGQIFSAILFAILMVLLELRSPVKVKKSQYVREWFFLLLGMGFVMIAEFMLEKKIVFVDFVPMDVCYVLMILACTGMVLALSIPWKRQDVE